MNFLLMQVRFAPEKTARSFLLTVAFIKFFDLFISYYTPRGRNNRFPD